MCCNKNLSTVYLALDAEMLRLWEETDPFHQIDYCMDDVYAQLGDQVSIDYTIKYFSYLLYSNNQENCLIWMYTFGCKFANSVVDQI